MVKVKEDLTGRAFGRLTVLEQAEDYVKPNGVHCSMWRCLCNNDGNIVEVRGSALKNGATVSCGCYRDEIAAILAKEKFSNPNTYDLTGEYGICYLYDGSECLFDKEDFDKIKDLTWCLDGHGYALARKGVDKEVIRIKMHRLIMDAPDGFDVDHINHNTIDNRKNNLRICTRSQNNTNQTKRSDNTSGIIGVSLYRNSKWRADISINKKRTCLGYFINKDDAIKARLKAELKYYGEYAPQKFLFERYGITTQND